MSPSIYPSNEDFRAAVSRMNNMADRWTILAYLDGEIEMKRGLMFWIFVCGTVVGFGVKWVIG